jgi:hypothetical protein
VVSEERGAISLVFNGNMVRDVDASSLRDALPGLLFRRIRRKKRKNGSHSRHSVPAGRAQATTGRIDTASAKALREEGERGGTPEETKT